MKLLRANPNVDTLCSDSIFCTDIPALRNDFSWTETDTDLSNYMLSGRNGKSIFNQNMDNYGMFIF